MRTNIVIDDRLMDQAIRTSRLRTKKQAVEEGLRLLIQLRRQSRIRNARGRLKWIGNLRQMRLDK